MTSRINKFKTGQGEDHTKGCFLDYDCIQSHYRLIAADLIGQIEKGADPKAIEKILMV